MFKIQEVSVLQIIQNYDEENIKITPNSSKHKVIIIIKRYLGKIFDIGSSLALIFDCSSIYYKINFINERKRKDGEKQAVVSAFLIPSHRIQSDDSL